MNPIDREKLLSYVLALRPIIYIQSDDFLYADSVIGSLMADSEILEFSNSGGHVDFGSKAKIGSCDLSGFLTISALEQKYERKTFLLLKDVHKQLDHPEIIALLKCIARRIILEENYDLTIFLLSNQLIIPKELLNLITVYRLKNPQESEIAEMICEFKNFHDFSMESDTVDELSMLLIGFDRFSIQQILNLAYQRGGAINKGDYALIHEEKKQMILKNSMVELIETNLVFENEVGGLDVLREWLSCKAVVFQNLEKARKNGVDIPKGLLLAGMPGCGKSLSAKATANMFKVPLLRMDVGRLLGRYVGESEENMRRALSVAESVSPCVLWIDEIEKAFSGIGSGGNHEVTTRLFGYFLTWMQEKKSTVFVIATTNDVTQLPLEFLRKGRFDEIFKVDFPISEERRKIFDIHIRKRLPDVRIDTGALMKPSDKFSGADIEAVVKNVVESHFLKKMEPDAIGDECFVPTVQDFIAEIECTKPITETLKDRISQMREVMNKIDFKDASSGVE